MIKRFVKNNAGATVVEYGLIVAVIALVMAGGLGSFSSSLNNLFSDTSGRLDNSVASE